MLNENVVATAVGTASVCFAAPAESVRVNDVRRTSPPNVSSMLCGEGTDASAAGTDVFNGVCACAAQASAKPRANATKRVMGGSSKRRFYRVREAPRLKLSRRTAGSLGAPQHRWYGGGRSLRGTPMPK